MASILFHIIFFCLILRTTTASGSSFNQNYEPYFGLDHFKLIQGGQDEAQLTLDQNGGAGFRSKAEYQSGRFHIRMKIPRQKTRGIIPNFYLISREESGIHTELDFEFLGTTGDLQTNMFANDLGGREQHFHLWFDPSEDFHSYSILWNQHQVVFLVDNIPITVYKNNSAMGAKFPSEPLHIEATIWNGTWVGNVDWSVSPFTTSYRNFEITGCQADNANPEKCASPEFKWNAEDQWDLTPQQKQKLENIRKKYMYYDYCNQPNAKSKYPECAVSRS
ncbi:OLC1v1006773C1 [Oldenlandia corymbosa var. corymbosa]|uniref:Xyloglucan endotransglucosylase/hydrolase n=1 Tax=Oldenlandia corymbosa var. corymbosa TaxID=529605 RepID=A0AAV1DIA4_OLDCO|nr:OLC1v1006773C1 [Oldenlandia corymbosa var. corymbosa]